MIAKKLPIEGQTLEVKGREAFLIMPDEPSRSASDRRIPWVWYAPTLPGLPGDAEVWMFEKFLANGFAIAGVDVGESFGSPEGRAIFTSFYNDLTGSRGLAPKACMLARSRGGLMLYNWAVENPGAVACIAGIYPVCNLKSYPGLGKACGAYDMTEVQLEAALIDHNPIDRLAPLAQAGVPISHIHGDCDTVVPLEDNSGELALRYERLGGTMTLEVVEGQGHNMWQGWFRSQALIDFVITHRFSEKI
jgi:pimeloyl-ACP methyl ester carboxylesterase